MSDIHPLYLKQAERLAELSDDTILEVLGLELLALDPPARTVGLSRQLESTAAIGHVTAGGGIEEVEALIPVTFRAIADIVGDTRRRAAEFLAELEPKVRAALCDGAHLREEVARRVDSGELAVKIISEVVCAAQGIPPVFAAIPVTVAAWYTKKGIDAICRSSR